MTEKRILFGKFEFPVEKGFDYVINENVPETDIDNDTEKDAEATDEDDSPETEGKKDTE